jgi:hypothetical protein
MTFVILAAVIILVIWHVSKLDTYYIEFTGTGYFVWQRKFGGYNDCKGLFKSEKEAKEFIEKLKSDPPRTIEG